MKRHLGWLIIALAVVVSSSAAQGQGIPIEAREVIVAGSVPAGYGMLRGVTRGDVGGEMRLIFEDSKGAIRIVSVLNIEDRWAVGRVVVVTRGQ